MKGKITLALALIVGMLLAGCVSEYNIDLESLSAGKDAKAYTYEILSADSAVRDDDLMFIKLKNILKESLTDSGFKVADNEGKADAVLLFSAKMSEPDTKMTKMSGGTSTSYYNSSTKSTKTYGGDSYATYSTTYHQTIKIDALEYNSASKKQGAMLWKMEVLSEGSSNDMQNVFKRFVKGMEQFYGKDSDGRKIVKLEFNNKTGELFKLEIKAK